MSKHGINVPKGVAAGSIDEVKKAIRDVFPNQSEVIQAKFRFLTLCRLRTLRKLLGSYGYNITWTFYGLPLVLQLLIVIVLTRIYLNHK